MNPNPQKMQWAGVYGLLLLGAGIIMIFDVPHVVGILTWDRQVDLLTLDNISYYDCGIVSFSLSSSTNFCFSINSIALLLLGRCIFMS